jgi:hypothetical protein
MINEIQEDNQEIRNLIDVIQSSSIEIRQANVLSMYVDMFLTATYSTLTNLLHVIT